MKDIIGKNKKDLEAMLRDKQEALRVFRFGISGTKTRNVREGRALRKDVAHIMTELTRLKSKAS